MSLTIPTVAQLSQFSGRPLRVYTPYADQALLQASVVMSLVTQLTDMPEDSFDSQIMTFGILAYADHLVLTQPYQQVAANPFQSENVGGSSYSKPVQYTRGNADANALKGETTGIVWFDYAVQKLALRTEFGGIYGEALLMKWDEEVLVVHDHETGCKMIIGPAERNRLDLTGFSGDFSGENWPALENPS